LSLSAVAAVAAAEGVRHPGEFGLLPGGRVVVDAVGATAAVVASAVTTVISALVIASGERASEEDGTGAANDRSAVESALADSLRGGRRRRVRRVVPSGRVFGSQSEFPL
jgi:hypothetical protein